jgi:hypothetical protein
VERVSVERLKYAIAARFGTRLFKEELARTLGGPATETPSTPTRPHAVSIIVPTCERPDDLRRCLESLTSQTTRHVVEIVVVDNKPASASASTVARDFPSVRIVTESRPGLSYARNAGIAAELYLGESFQYSCGYYFHKEGKPVWMRMGHLPDADPKTAADAHDKKLRDVTKNPQYASTPVPGVEGALWSGHDGNRWAFLPGWSHARQLSWRSETCSDEGVIAVMKQLATRVPFPGPASLVEREIDRRLEDFARRLMDQRIDPRQANIDWNAFREGQRAPATEAVGSAIVLDEIAKRDQIDVTDDDLE